MSAADADRPPIPDADPAADDEAYLGRPDYQDLSRRRATVALREEDVLRAVRLGGQGYHLHALHSDFERESVVLVLVHPDLRPVEPGMQPPSLDARALFGVELKVFVDEASGEAAVWERSKITVEEARLAELSAVAATQLRAVARYRLGYNPDWLTCPEVGCPDPTIPVPGEGTGSADVGDLLRVALHHQERFHHHLAHLPPPPPGAPG